MVKELQLFAAGILFHFTGVLDMEKLFTPQEVAERLRLELPTVREMLWSGRIPSIKVGRLRRIRLEDLERIEKEGVR